MAKASVIASSGDDEAVSSDSQEDQQLKESSRRADVKADSRSAGDQLEQGRPARPALLAMKLTESETSEDDIRNRQEI